VLEDDQVLAHRTFDSLLKIHEPGAKSRVLFDERVAGRDERRNNGLGSVDLLSGRGHFGISRTSDEPDEAVRHEHCEHHGGETLHETSRSPD